MLDNVTVKELLGWKKAGDIGLELEVESTIPLPVIETDPWRTQGDNSLRGHAAEYYTHAPIAADRTKATAISALVNELRKNEGLLHDSPRTSLHVHVNILNHTPLQVWTAVATYWLLENLLLEYCGKSRQGNLFCLRLKDAEAILANVLTDLKRDLPFEMFRDEGLRYAGQNLNAIRKFGSLEYRGMRGVIDAGIIDRWSTQMYNIVHRSKQFSSPEQMMETYQKVGPEGFMLLVLDRGFVEDLQHYKGWASLIKQQSGLLCEFCYVHGWERWQQRVNERAKHYGFLGRTQWHDAPRTQPHRLGGQDAPAPRVGRGVPVPNWAVNIVGNDAPFIATTGTTTIGTTLRGR